VAVGGERTLELELTNAAAYAFTEAVVRFSNNAYSLISPAVPLTVPAGGRLTLTVRFRPGAAGAGSGTMSIAGLPIALTGTGVVAAANPVPVLTAIAPTSAVAGAAAFTMTLTGSGFIRDSIVRWNGNARTTTLVSATSLTAAIPASDIAAAGAAHISVFNPPPSGGASVTRSFTITPTVASAPEIEVSPAALAFGDVVTGQAKDLRLSIRNTGNAVLTISSIAGSAALFAASGLTLPARIAPGASSDVTVRFSPVTAAAVSGVLTINSDASMRPGLTVALTGRGNAGAANAVPLLDSFLPATVTAGSAAFQLTVTGSRFADTSVVNLNGSPRPTSFVNAGELRTSIPPADLANPGSVNITVATPAPGGGVSNAKPLTIASAGVSAAILQFDQQACPNMTALVSALDAARNAITALGPANFRCTEDGVSVNCFAERASDAGFDLSVALVVDTSNSAGDLEAQKGAAIALMNGLGPADRMSVIQADSTAIVANEFASSRTVLSTVIGSLRNSGAGTGTALYDAMERAQRGAASQIGRRRAVVVFAGSENTAGVLRDSSALIASARSLGIPVFTLPFGGANGKQALADLFHQLALDTAGHFLPGSSSLLLAAERLGIGLANQYAITFNSPRTEARMRLFGVTMTAAQGSSATAAFYRACP